MDAMHLDYEIWYKSLGIVVLYIIRFLRFRPFHGLLLIFGDFSICFRRQNAAGLLLHKQSSLPDILQNFHLLNGNPVQSLKPLPLRRRCSPLLSKGGRIRPL